MGKTCKTLQLGILVSTLLCLCCFSICSTSAQPHLHALSAWPQENAWSISAHICSAKRIRPAAAATAAEKVLNLLCRSPCLMLLPTTAVLAGNARLSATSALLFAFALISVQNIIFQVCIHDPDVLKRLSFCWHMQPPLGTRRTIILSGMYDGEVIEVISAYRDSGRFSLSMISTPKVT